MRGFLWVLPAIALAAGCQTGSVKMEKELSRLIADLELQVRDLEKKTNIAYFDAVTSGKQEVYDTYSRLNIQLSTVYSDREIFSRLRELRESGKIRDSLLARQLDILYNTFLANQMDKEKLEAIIKAQTDLEQKFSTYRALIDGKAISDNDIDSVLKNSNDSRELEKFWLASKQIGDTVAADVISLVRMRNAVARDLGFSNYHDMSLRLSDQDPEQVEKLFDELDELTRDAFASLKAAMDQKLAARYHVPTGELMPWHYQNRFFQEAPAIYEVNLDDYYKNKDVVQLAEDYFTGIGLEVSGILSRSDLYEREGKYQHAFCTNIDRAGDVRIVCNVRNDSYWMNTMLHELGHGVHDTGIDMQLPFFLRTYAHSFTTEAIANFFGRLSSNPFWIQENLGVSAEEAEKIKDDVTGSLRLEQLVFSRWSQVMFRFEKSLYADPDQDLNQLWWSLVEKYQLLSRPEGRDHADWASKIHIASYPCYYHNYLLGQLFASQLLDYIESNVITASGGASAASLSNNPAIGEYLTLHVFRAGARYPWYEMIRKATGEELSPRFYAQDFIN